MLPIWSLVLLPFLNPAWTSGSSQFTYCWRLTWRIFSITLLVCEWVQVCSSLNILWHCPSLGLEWKLTFSRSVTPRNSDPTRNWPRLACECPGASGRGMGSLWPASGLGSLHVAVSPSVSLSHQKAFISHLSFSIRGQTEWKTQSQNHLRARWNTTCEYFISNGKR